MSPPAGAGATSTLHAPPPAARLDVAALVLSLLPLLPPLLCLQRLRDFRADAWMSVGLSVGSVVKDNTGCIMAHALGVHLLDVSGNTFFEGPPTAPQVMAEGLLA